VRLAIYGDLLRKLVTDLPYVSLFNFDSYVAISSNFTIPAAPLLVHNFEAPWAMFVKKA
jgi:hypothetical protein